MKNEHLIFLLIWTMMSCDNSSKKDNYKAFDFSYNNTFSTCFSIKFTQSDTVLIRQHWASSFDTTETLKSNTNYFATISEYDRFSLDSLLNKINFAKLDTIYYQNYSDGNEYKFYVKKDSINKTIYVHSHTVPKEVENLAYWIVDLKKKLNLKIIDSTLTFGSIEHFLPPPPPPPSFRNAKRRKK